MPRRSGVPMEGPAPGGPYSHAVRIASTVAIAGQCGYQPDRSLVEGVTAQTRLALENLRNALESVGAGLADVVAVNAYLTELDHFSEFNSAYAEYFDAPYPARTTIYCTLRPGVLVELSASAVVSDE